ncbi:hypothetical protein ACCO45_008109 [Purpureocillium lilacinum]|uniref:Uncharacterized protein n=1 Tax=Purpureocillium lilacinum TaxID=33203 RepID=A0ACC4DMP4_PURLI
MAAAAEPNWRRTSIAPRAAVGARVALAHPHPHLHQHPHQEQGHDQQQHEHHTQQHTQQPQTQTQPQQYLAPTSGSRFRKLRGKSVSSPRAIDVFRDSPSNSGSDEEGLHPQGHHLQGHLVHSVSQSSSCYSTDTPKKAARRRSKSVTTPPTNYHYGGTVPTSGALSPKPVNVASVDPSLAAFEGVKPPPVYRGRDTHSTRPRAPAPIPPRPSPSTRSTRRRTTTTTTTISTSSANIVTSANSVDPSKAPPVEALAPPSRRHRPYPRRSTTTSNTRNPTTLRTTLRRGTATSTSRIIRRTSSNTGNRTAITSPRTTPSSQATISSASRRTTSSGTPLAQEQNLSPPPLAHQQYEPQDLDQRSDDAATREAPVADATQPKEACQTPQKPKQQQQRAKQESPAAAQSSHSAERQHYQQDLASVSPDRGQQQKTSKQVQQYQHETTSQGTEEDADRVAEEVARLEAETDRILAEQKKLDLLRLQATLETPPKPKRSLLGLEKLFVSRGKKSNHGSSQPSTPDTLAPSIFSPALSHFSHRSSVDDSPIPFKMGFIEPGGKGIVPQTDAPASAINGGERIVMVRCQSATVNLPISAETSPDDIIQAVAQRTKQQLSTSSSVLIECYFALGLERRLRRYERIRDTLNSWDNDQQNSLLIMPADSPVDLKGLELSSVPRTEDSPSGFCVQLYHSSRPGKWAKRWKVCYAIKSQQKTIVFPNGENFVHFFCTDDEALAARFLELVHGWRSWYLANMLVDLDKKNKAPAQNEGPLVSRAKSRRNPNGTLGVTIDKSAEPLWDVTGFKSPDVATLTRTLTLASKDRAKTNTAQSPTADAEAEFAASGLLGSIYDKRAAEAATSTRVIKVEGPFTDGPSLLNGGVAQKSPDASSTKTEPKGWFPSAAEHTARLRAQSDETKRPPLPPPLLSFADNHRGERHSRYGEPPHGYARSHHGGGGQPLINFATGGQALQPHGAAPQRGMSRRGLPPSGSSSNSLGSQHSHHSQQHSPSMRGRSRSTASRTSGAPRPRYPEEQRPPPMPQRSVRHREGPSPRGPPPQWQPSEPLVNRAR